MKGSAKMDVGGINLYRVISYNHERTEAFAEKIRAVEDLGNCFLVTDQNGNKYFAPHESIIYDPVIIRSVPGGYIYRIKVKG